MHVVPLQVDSSSIDVEKEARHQGLLERLLPVALVFFLFVSPWFYGLVRFRDQLIAECFILTLFIVSFSWIKGNLIFRPSANQMDFWVFLIGVVSAGYTLISSVPYQSLLAFSKLFSLLLWYAIVRSAVNTLAKLNFFLWGIFLTGFFYAAYGLAQYYDFVSHSYWSLPYAVASRFVNSGHFAVFLIFPLMIGISFLISSKNGPAKLISFFFLLTITWALVLTRSRAGWGLLLIGPIIFFWKIFRSGSIRPANLGFFLLPTLFAAAFFLYQTGALQLILERIGDMQRNKFFSLVHRLELWKAALAAIEVRPWGWGLGTFIWVFPPFKIQSDRFLVDYAHNEFLQIGVDLGIPGVLLLAAFLFFYLKKILRFKDYTSLSFAATFVCLALASQVDFPLRIYANALFFSTFLALSRYLFQPSLEKKAPGGSAVMKWGLFISVFFMLFVSSRQLLAEISFQQAQLHDQNFRWNDALKNYERAARLAPSYGRYQQALGNLYLWKASFTFQKTDKLKFREKSVEAYQKAVRALPYDAEAHRILGLALEGLGSVEEAHAYLKKAAWLDPKNGFFLVEYGNFAVRHSRPEEAEMAFRKLLPLTYWGESPETVCSILTKFYKLTQDYLKVSSMTPDNDGAHLCLGYVLEETGRWNQAKIEFEQAIGMAALTSPEYAKQLREHLRGIYESHEPVKNESDIPSI